MEFTISVYISENDGAGEEGDAHLEGRHGRLNGVDFLHDHVHQRKEELARGDEQQPRVGVYLAHKLGAQVAPAGLPSMRGGLLRGSRSQERATVRGGGRSTFAGNRITECTKQV